MAIDPFTGRFESTGNSCGLFKPQDLPEQNAELARAAARSRTNPRINASDVRVENSISEEEEYLRLTLVCQGYTRAETATTDELMKLAAEVLDGKAI